MAVAIFYLCPTPDHQPGRGRPLLETLSPLRHMRVWRFSLYYIVVFGAYVALSAWLPKFYIDTYGVSLSTAALLAATFILPASLLRPVGGHLADRWGPRGVTDAVFIVMTGALLVLPWVSARHRSTPSDIDCLHEIGSCMAAADRVHTCCRGSSASCRERRTPALISPPAG